MKTILNNLQLLVFIFIFNIANSQVEGVKYFLQYNEVNATYDVFIKISKGKAKSAIQRAQFNAQMSLVVPTSSVVKITENYMPLQANNNYDSSTPQQWAISSLIVAPEVMPSNDFYSITPYLAPTAFYNDLNLGDEVKLFSVSISPKPKDMHDVRFFENGKDPASNDKGMYGGDFSNGFTIGSVKQLFDGILPTKLTSNFLISAVSSVTKDEVKIYPNPTNGIINIGCSSKIKNVNLINADGKIINSESTNQINISNYDAGIYFLEVQSEKGRTIKKVSKI